MNGPNPLRVAVSIGRVLLRSRAPRPQGSATVDHSGLRPVLAALADGGVPALAGVRRQLDSYLQEMATVDPDGLSRDEALAYWLNLYNAGAVRLAARAAAAGAASVLRVPAGFGSVFISVAGESLSLDAIEHAKVRRFGDPRIHGALVCGSVSCPTLRAEPYRGAGLGEELDAQLRTFLAEGGAVLDADGRLMLSRVFLWYGGDFTRPARMPTFWPARRRALVGSLRPWLPAGHDEPRRVDFQPYDWGLRCAVR